MDSTYHIPFIVLGAIGFVVFHLRLAVANQRAFKVQRAVFQSRPLMDAAAWYVEHFARSGMPRPEVVRYLTPIAEAMQCSVSQLRADDSFDGTLAFKGKSFLGLSDDDPLDDFFERDLPRLLGGTQLADNVVSRITSAPTLLALISSIQKVTCTTASAVASSV